MDIKKMIESFKQQPSIRTLREELFTVSGYKVIIGTVIVLFFVFIAIFAPVLSQYNPEARVADKLQTPSSDHWFGTTKLGRDLFSRLMYGTRIALTVILAATAIAMSVGISMGLISGYTAGKSDRALVLVMDALYSFPGILLAILIIAAIGQGIIPAIIAVSVVYIPQYFRITRNHVMSVKQEVFVKAARAIGSPGKDTILKYILPNVSQSIPVILTLNAADGILTLAGLSFLGLGIVPPTPSWGYDLYKAWGMMSSAGLYPQIWYYSLIPGIFIVVIIVGFTLVGEGLNDILNPQLREGKRQ